MKSTWCENKAAIQFDLSTGLYEGMFRRGDEEKNQGCSSFCAAANNVSSRIAALHRGHQILTGFLGFSRWISSTFDPMYNHS